MSSNIPKNFPPKIEFVSNNNTTDNTESISINMNNKNLSSDFIKINNTANDNNSDGSDNSDSNNNIIISQNNNEKNKLSTSLPLGQVIFNNIKYTHFLKIPYLKVGNITVFYKPSSIINSKLPLQIPPFAIGPDKRPLFILIPIIFIAIVISIILMMVVFKHPLIRLSYLIYFFLTMFFYLHTVFINPGIRHYYFEQNDNENKFTNNISVGYCNICHIYFDKNDKVEHCKFCNICVEKRDHHCGVVGACIGKNNIITFFAMLICCCLLQINLYINLILYFITKYDN